jgi:hypothetical protein
VDLQTAVATVVALGTAAAMLTRYVVALIQLGADLPKWIPGTVALVIGIMAAALLAMVQGLVWTPAQLAIVILAGVVAAAEAEGLSRVQMQAHKATVARQLDK